MAWFSGVYFRVGSRWILIAIAALWILLLLLNWASSGQSSTTSGRMGGEQGKSCAACVCC